MTVFDLPQLTTEEKHCDSRLREASIANLGQDWKDCWQTCWPDHLEKTKPLAFLSDIGPFASLHALIRRAEERATGKEAVVFIENLTLPWTLQLGAAWNLDPMFFSSHVCPLTDEEAENTLHECRVPGSKGGLRSSRHGGSWATLRGYVDLGKPKRPLTSADFVDTTKRRHESSVYETRQSHTNLSYYRVSDSLCKP